MILTCCAEDLYMLIALLCLIVIMLVLIERGIEALRTTMREIWRCPKCYGTGTLPEWDEFAGEKCGDCRGTGWRE